MIRLALLVAVLALVLDQASKLVMLGVMDPPRVIEVTGFFNLVLAYNRGVSFGLFAGDGGWQVAVFSLLALAVSVLLLVWLRRQQRRLNAWCVGLIIGGAIGNALDRIRLGAVVDFLDLHAGGWHWPAFNLADSAIVLGVGLLLLDGLFSRPGTAKTSDQGGSPDGQR